MTNAIATPSHNPMPFDDLEKIYDQLAIAIDKAGEAHESQFLAKLVILLAHENGDRARVSAHIDNALQDLG